jgi:hypothetical protein
MPKLSQRKREMRAAKKICDIILAGLERFPAKERKARLDRIHLILTGQRTSRKSAKSGRTRGSLSSSGPRAAR